MTEKKNELMNAIFNKCNEVLDSMQKNPDQLTKEDTSMLEKLYSRLCQTLGVSEHSQWRVEWRVEKWADTARKLAGFMPDEVAVDTQNIILDGGANEMLKIITGTGGTTFNHNNARIYVGTDTTPENASQSGVLATGVNKAVAQMDDGYPIVQGRQMIFRASFGDTMANFQWGEASITNGDGANAIAMNRKVADLGTKTTGTWSLQITISLTSVA